MMDLESQPIKTLDELLEWTTKSARGRPSSVDLHVRNAWTENNNKPRTLLCHDMRGGYLADRFVICGFERKFVKNSWKYFIA